MRTFLIIIGLFLFIGNSFAQSYEELIEKSYDFVDKGDLVSAEESLKAAMRKEPANPLNYALLTNLGTIQRRQGKLQEALISYTSALSGHTKNITILENRASLIQNWEKQKSFERLQHLVNRKSGTSGGALLPRAALYTVTKLYVGRTGFRQNSGSKREIGSCSPRPCHLGKDAWELRRERTDIQLPD